MTDLAEYRSLIQLDLPFQAAPPAPPEELHRLVRQLINELLVEFPEGMALMNKMRAQGCSDRDMLKALLTVKPAEPFLSATFHSQLDRLLQREQQQRAWTEAKTLPILADAIPSTSFRSAKLCSLWQGDITGLRVDAIVNAANDALLGCFHPFHACIDNAIHSVAGPRLREDCFRIMEMQGHPENTGAAKATRGYNLPAAFVLHTVGPINQRDGETVTKEERDALASCYRSCLDLALELPNVRTLAFCCISTGVFGFPQRIGAEVALQTVDHWQAEHPSALARIIFNVFADRDREIYQQLLAEWPNAMGR